MAKLYARLHDDSLKSMSRKEKKEEFRLMVSVITKESVPALETGQTSLYALLWLGFRHAEPTNH